MSAHTITIEKENAVWSYETPLADLDAIGGHVAFYNALLPGTEERLGDD